MAIQTCSFSLFQLEVFVFQCVMSGYQYGGCGSIKLTDR